jgi:hypothetical protein
VAVGGAGAGVGVIVAVGRGSAASIADAVWEAWILVVGTGLALPFDGSSELQARSMSATIKLTNGKSNRGEVEAPRAVMARS